jgi:predicted dehydrogenase
MHAQNHVTRRDFVKASAALAAGGAALSGVGAVAGAASATTSRTSGPNDQIKVGLVGCGGRGCGAALDAIFADPNSVIYAAADVFPDRLSNGLNGINAELHSRVESGTAAPKVRDQMQVPESRQFDGFEGYRKVIAECDAVILATPPHFRPMHLRAAIDAGRHVFCEKPVAVDAPGVRSVLESVELAQSKNLTLVSGFCWRYAARERDTYAKIHEGAIGDIRAVYTTYNTGGWVKPVARDPQWSEMEYQLRCWHYFPWLSGDHIVEQACHAIDKLAWAMNDVPPVQCVAVGGRQCRDQMGEPGSVFDHFAVAYEYASGARGFHMCRHFPNSPFDNADTIIGSKGTCRVDGWAGVHEITGETNWKCATPKNEMYQQEHDEFFASIRSGTPINDGVRMTNSTMMAIMARMAAYTAQAITWEQAMNSKEELRPSAYQLGDAPAVNVARPGLTKFS